MKIIGIIDEDFVNYKKSSMIIEFPYCDLKCDKECGESVCQNSSLLSQTIVDINTEKLVDRYLNNNITNAIVCQGLEPFNSFNDLYNLIKIIRVNYNVCDDIVIYTGYEKNEIEEQVNELTKFKNIYIKYGRFIPNKEHHFDEVLGVELASPNQYAEKVS